MARWSGGRQTALVLELGRWCHWPGCERPPTVLVDGRPVLDVDIAHIRAEQPAGKRHDPSWGADRLNGLENLMLLCRPHHKEVDGADADRYPVELLESWRSRRLSARFEPDPAAAGGSSPRTAWRTWCTVGELDARSAGVRPGRPSDGGSPPAYVPRDREGELAELLARIGAHGGLVLVVGETASGKSRLALEAARKVLPDHLVCRAPRGGLQAAVSAALLCPRDRILWLDRLEQYDGLEDLDVAELRRHRVPVLATVNSRHLPPPRAGERRGERDGVVLLPPALLDQAEPLVLDRAWSPVELRLARESPDPVVRYAAERCTHGGVSEFLAAGPELSLAWRTAGRVDGNPRGAALVRAAVDLARTGLGGPLAADLIARAHHYYLVEAGGELLRPEPMEEAFAWAKETRIGMTGLLQPVGEQGLRPFAGLFDEPAAQPAEPVHPLLWFDAFGGAPDVATAWTVAANAQRDDPAVARFLWRVLREAGLASAVRCEAAALLALGHHEEALRLLDDHADGDDGWVRHLVAMALEGLGRLDEAELAFGRAAEAGAEHARFNLGVLLARQGRTVDAIRAYRLAGADGDTDALLNLGQLLVEDGQPDAALPVLRRAADAGCGESRLELANLLKLLGRTDEAERSYRRSIEAGDARAWVNLGNLHAAGGRPEEAELAYRQAIGAGLSVAHGYLGRHLAARERWPEAVPHLRRAVADGAADVALQLGRALAAAGETEEAKQVYRTAARAGEASAAVGFCTVADESDEEERRTLLRQAADAGDPDAMVVWTVQLDAVGDRRGADALRRRIRAGADPVAHALLAAYDEGPRSA